MCCLQRRVLTLGSRTIHTCLALLPVHIMCYDLPMLQCNESGDPGPHARGSLILAEV